MFEYSFIEWIFFFYIYCFVGWCIESTIVSLEKRKFVNRGFLRSPFLPIYGFGAIIILFVCLPFKENPLLVYIFGMAGTTALEYFTGWIMEAIFKMRYWDYSSQKFNIKGRICLTPSLFWGFLSMLLTYVLHTPIENFVLDLSNKNLIIITTVISVVFVSDTIYSFYTAIDVNKLLEHITTIRIELRELTRQIEERVTGKLESNEKLTELIERMEKLKAENIQLKEKISFSTKNFIKAHPTASNKRFSEALIEIREAIETRRNK